MLVPAGSERARRSSYRFRFGLIYVFLLAVVGAGVGSFIVLASGADKPDEPAWSAWQPTGSTMAKVRQIADRIPKAYRAENGSQLTVSLASRSPCRRRKGERAGACRLRPPGHVEGARGGGRHRRLPRPCRRLVRALRHDSKEQCEVAPDGPAERETLLRRQALELSLYTLKYVDGIDSVVVFMPPEAEEPEHGLPAPRATWPTSSTGRSARCSRRRARRSARLSSLEEGQILRLTRPRTYTAEVQASPDGSPILILTPPGARLLTRTR